MPNPATPPAADRHTITDITLTLKRADGTIYTRAIDPNECDALVWSDRAVQVFGKFYDKGGPAQGKRMLREDFLHHFPQATAIIGNQPDLLMTPAVIDQLWTTPKADQTKPAFLVKSIKNPVNG